MIDHSNISVLIVDDEDDIREVLEIAVLDMGYRLFTAENGKKALDIFKEQKIDVVVTDIKMPVMDGIELLRRVKRLSPDTEVLMITGHGDMDLTIRSLKNEATDFITKPVNVNVLEISIEKAVEKIVARQQLAEYTRKLESLILEKTHLASHLSSLGLMMGTLSHNIKGLLTNLDGGIYLTRSGMEKNDPATMKEGLDFLVQAAGRIKKTVMDILLYSKERKLNRTKIKSDELMADITAYMNTKLKNLPISFTCQSADAPDTVFIDKEFIMTALTNILENAVDACLFDNEKPSHDIQFELAKKGNQVQILITDNGCGMDAQVKEKIFDLFFSSKKTQGTGFGLYITNSIIRQHDGSIHVMSIKGKETRFKISLPQ